MPDRVVEVIDGTDRWWPPVKRIRDIVAHREHANTAFGGASVGVHFQIYEPGIIPQVIDPHLLWTGGNNVADFRRYSALILAELLVFLDELGMVLAATLRLSPDGLTRSMLVGDFTYLLEAMEQLLKDDDKP